MLIVKLKPRKELPVLSGHPWVYSGAVDKVQGTPEEERICRVLDSRGHFICQGIYNPLSQLAVRVLTLGKEDIDRKFFEARIRNAIDMRSRIMAPDNNCYRLINSEGDFLPGLMVDRYNEVLVIQIIAPGMEDFKADIVDILHARFPSYAIFERSDTRQRSSEGLRPVSGMLHGKTDGSVQVMENGIPFIVDIFTGDRSGFYLDQREIRKKVMAHARDASVLDLFCYTGSFSLYALKGGANSVVSVDSSSPGQALLKKNMELNRIKPFVWRHNKDDIFRLLNDDRETYDLVTCDPPAFNKEYDEHMKVAGLAMARVKPGGLLFYLAQVTGDFSAPDLLKIIARSAKDLSRKVRIIEPLAQSPDFAYLPSHPQGMYLTGFVMHIS